MFVECSSMNRYFGDLSHPPMTIVARHRTNPQSRELRPVAVEGGKVGRKYLLFARYDLPPEKIFLVLYTVRNLLEGRANMNKTRLL